MRGPRRIFALALVAVAVFAAGCGGDTEGKGIPVATADSLHNQLDNVQARIDQGSAGACKDIIEAPASRGSNKQQVQDLIQHGIKVHGHALLALVEEDAESLGGL